MTIVRSIVLAAGEGRRMGGNKGLVPFRGRPLIHHVLDVIDRSRIEGAVVVTGAESDALTAVVGARARVVENATWRAGQTSSLKTGLAALPDDTDAFLIQPVDHALVTVEDLDALVEVFELAEGRDRFIARPVSGGTFGHPVLFAISYRDDFAGLADDHPGNAVYRAHLDDVRLVPVDNPLIGVDLDTPADLQAHE